MKANVQYLGYCPNEAKPYMYAVLTESGVCDDIFESFYLGKGGVYDLSDEQWGETSGWVQCRCDSCGTIYWTRACPGGQVKCEHCGVVEQLPSDAVMREYEGCYG